MALTIKLNESKADDIEAQVWKLIDANPKNQAVAIPAIQIDDIHPDGTCSGDLSYMDCLLVNPKETIPQEELDAAKAALEKDAQVAGKSLEKAIASHKDTPESKAYFDYVVLDTGNELLPIFHFEHLSVATLAKTCLAIGHWWTFYPMSYSKIVDRLRKEYGL